MANSNSISYVTHIYMAYMYTSTILFIILINTKPAWFNILLLLKNMGDCSIFVWYTFSFSILKESPLNNYSFLKGFYISSVSILCK